IKVLFKNVLNYWGLNVFYQFCQWQGCSIHPRFRTQKIADVPHPDHPLRQDEREIASAIATVRRAMSACSRSTIRPSIETTPLPLFSGWSNAAIILRACSTSVSDGEKALLQGSIWLGCINVLPSKPSSMPCAHSFAKPSALPMSL